MSKSAVWLTVSLIVLSITAGCQNDSDKASPTEPTAAEPTAAEPEVAERAKSVRQTQNAKLPSQLLRVRRPTTQQPDDWFRDDAEASGVRFAYSDGSDAGLYQLIESVGGGLCVFDLDGDSLQDLFFTGGGRLNNSSGNIDLTGAPSAVFRNAEGHFNDVTAATGLAHEVPAFTHGCTTTDFNSDGFDDVIVCGFGSVQLWQNLGDGSFINVADSAGFASNDWNVSAAAGDVNSDGLVDIYLLTYSKWQPDLSRPCLNDQGLRDICGPTLYQGTRDHLFVNTGSGFQDATVQAGLVKSNRGLGIVAADFDNDGHLDVSVVNDVEANQLYFGAGNGEFYESGVLSGVAYSNTGEREGSMGLDAGDFDRDGLADLWYTNYAQQDNSLLKNLASRGFVHAAGVTDLVGVSRIWVGFGTGFADFDSDGWEDLFVINGHVAYERLDSPYFQPPQLFRNQSGVRFSDVTEQGGPYFRQTWSGRGAATVDWNNDGTSDLVVVHQNDPVSILTNLQATDGWISVKLVGVASERSAVGASAQILLDGKPMKRWRCGGGNYLSQKDSRLLFALPDALPDALNVDVQVTWLGGATEIFEDLVSKQTHTLVQGRGKVLQP